MPSRRSQREQNRARKIAKLNDDCCASRKILRSVTVFKKLMKKKKTCDRKRFKADPESKKDIA